MPKGANVYPFFSIILPTYNRAEKLKLSLLSVINQTFGNFEVLVMDDGSTDETEAVVKSFNDSRIKYSWEVNSGGPAKPRNRGISFAKGKWICFLDSDDIWLPGKLERVSQNIFNNHIVDVICHNEIINIPSKNISKLLVCGPYQNDFYRAMLLNGNRLSTSATSIKTEFLHRTNLRFNESINYVIVEDYDLWLRIALHNANFVFINEALGEYILDNDNLTTDGEKYRRNLMTLLHDHVFNIQTFQDDKKNLWRIVKIRVLLSECKENIVGGHKLRGIASITVLFLKNPIITIKILIGKIP